MLLPFFSPGRAFTRRRAADGRPANLGRRLSLEHLEPRCLLSADPILEWNAVALEVNRISYSGGVVNDQIGPTRSSRALAIESVAMFDAYNSVHPACSPYLTFVQHAEDASDVAAVAQAAHDTIVAMYPHQQAYIDAALTQSLAQVHDGRDKTLGIEVGTIVAQAILAARTDDGSQIPGLYVPDGKPGHHVADPLNPNQGFLTPAWGGVTTFGIPSTDAVPTPPPPSLTSADYTQAYNQVKSLGEDNSSTRTLDETEIGIYWGYDVARGLGDPPRLFNQVARQIAVQEGNTVAENARMFALINVAMADAGIQCWGIKYRDIFWRPIVAIRRANETGNPNTVQQTDWSPLGAPKSNPLPGEINFTPPFPSYTSGHADFAGAAFKTMADFYQTDDVHYSISFNFISDEFNGVTTDIHQNIPPIILNFVRQLEPRHYTSFSQAAAEVAASRIYLGIHYRFDAIQGVSAGDRIADIDFDSLLRPLQGHAPDHVATVNFTAQIDAYLNGTYMDYFSHSHGADPSVLRDPGAPNLFKVIIGAGAFRLGMLDHDNDPLAVFRAVTTSSGAVELRTINGKPFDASLSKHPASATMPTTATSTHDAATMARNLILYLNGGVWGGASRGGHVLVVDLDAESGVLFKVF
jgi:hypothetical protein